MKSLLKISLTTLGILGICGASVLAVTGTVNAPSGLVLRETASTGGNPLTTLPDEAKVEVIEKDGDWYKVTYNSQTGYAYAEYVKVTEEVSAAPQEENENPQEEPKKPTANVSLKVYNIPLITSTVINEIEPNAEITVIKEITNWVYVSSGDVVGWVRSYGLNGGVTESEPAINNNETTEVNNEVTETEQTQEQPEETTPVANTEPTEAPTPTEQNNNETTATVTKGTIEVDTANIRKEASTNSEIVTALTRGTTFTINAETEEWYKITYTGIDGTVYEGYVFKTLVTAN